MKTLAKILGIGAIGLVSLLPIRASGQDIDNPNTLNPFYQPNAEPHSNWNYFNNESEKNSVLKDHFDIDTTDAIPGVPIEWDSGKFASQIVLNFSGYSGNDIPPEYDTTQIGRFNLPVYYAHISFPQGGGHGMNAGLTGNNPLNFDDWNIIEPQNDSLNVQPTLGSWNLPYGSRVTVTLTRDFKRPPYEDRIRGAPLVDFYINENGEDSTGYFNPDLIQVRPPIPRDSLEFDMNEDEQLEMFLRDLMYHERSGLEYRIVSGENVTLTSTDSSLIINPEKDYFGSVDLSWEYLGKFTQNQMDDLNVENVYRDTGFVSLNIQNIPDAPMVSVRDTSTTQRGRFDLVGESSDPDGDIASYSWEQLSGPAVSVRDSDKSTANFDLQGEGVYNFKYTVTDSTGLYDSDTLTVDASVLRVNNVANLPKEYSLGNNYPNPFNPSTTIEYSIPIGGKVSLDVYDLNGRAVRVLVREFKSAGSYTIDFNAADLASGLYFLKMQAGDFKATWKMMYLK